MTRFPPHRHQVDRVLLRALVDNLSSLGRGVSRNADLIQHMDHEYQTQKDEIISKLADKLGFSPEEREEIGLHRSALFHSLRAGEGGAGGLVSPPQGGAPPVGAGGAAVGGPVEGGAAVEGGSLSEQFIEYLHAEARESPR